MSETDPLCLDLEAYVAAAIEVRAGLGSSASIHPRV